MAVAGGGCFLCKERKRAKERKSAREKARVKSDAAVQLTEAASKSYSVDSKGRYIGFLALKRSRKQQRWRQMQQPCQDPASKLFSRTRTRSQVCNETSVSKTDCAFCTQLSND